MRIEWNKKVTSNVFKDIGVSLESYMLVTSKYVFYV